MPIRLKRIKHASQIFCLQVLLLASVLPSDAFASQRNRPFQIGIFHHQVTPGIDKGGGGIAVARIQGLHWYPAYVSSSESLVVPPKTFRLFVLFPKGASLLVRREGGKPFLGKLKQSRDGKTYLVLDSGSAYQLKLLSPGLFGF